MFWNESELSFDIRYGFVLCSIPKCGSTMLKMLLRRMMHKRNWRKIGNGVIHGPSKNGLISVNNKREPELAKVCFLHFFIKCSNPDFLKKAKSPVF